MDEQQQLLNVLDSIETAFDGDEWPSVTEATPAEEVAPGDLSPEPVRAEAQVDEPDTVEVPAPSDPPPIPRLPAVDVEAVRRPRRESPPPISCPPRVRQSTRAFLEHFHRVATP